MSGYEIGLYDDGRCGVFVPTIATIRQSIYLSTNMHEPVLPNLPNKWPVKLILAFTFIALFGLMPWEDIFSIQILNSTLKLLTGTTMGLFGLAGVLFTLLICIMLRKPPFALLIGFLLGMASLVVSGMFALSLVLPDFEWQDTDVYRNGNDYLVVQEQESFVTSNTQKPRALRTTSPYGMVRKIEEWVAPKYLDRFGGKDVPYDGKYWSKEALADK
jgi:hypothetical protein